MKHSLDLILATAAQRRCESPARISVSRSDLAGVVSTIANVRSINHGPRNTTGMRQRVIGSGVAQHRAGSWRIRRPVVRTPAEIVDKMIAMLQ
jgi:hypothetical protein